MRIIIADVYYEKKCESGTNLISTGGIKEKKTLDLGENY